MAQPQEGIAAEILDDVISQKKLDRDRGIEKLQRILGPNLSEVGDNAVVVGNQHAAAVQDVSRGLLKRLTDLKSLNTENLESLSWEYRYGTLAASTCLITGKSVRNRGEFDDFAGSLRDLSTILLTDSEPRVRLAAAEAIGVLCQTFGPSVYESVKSVVLSIIHENIVRQTETRRRTRSTSSSGGESDISTGDASEVLHDTAGWRSLETSMKCLQRMVEGCGADFLPQMDEDIFDLLSLTLDHMNRFVRETGFYLLSALIECGSAGGRENNKILTSRALIGDWLAKGLGDNWSQVRLAGSVATRKMLSIIRDYPESSDIFSLLVPPMCLNRYYLAEGVRLYSQESWRILSETVENGGGKLSRKLVSEYIKEVSAYYIIQTQADNHAVREAACHAIVELAVKVDTEVLIDRVPALLDALLVCFQDESWPVRDAACLASARFLNVYTEAGQDRLDKLLPFFWSQLG